MRIAKSFSSLNATRAFVAENRFRTHSAPLAGHEISMDICAVTTTLP